MASNVLWGVFDEPLQPMAGVFPEAGGGPTQDDDVDAWFASGGVTTQASLDAMATFAVGAKSLFGITALNQKFDRLFVAAGMGTRASSRLCLATRNSLSEVNSPGWTLYGPGFTGDAVSAALNFNWAPAAGPNVAQNSMCIGGVVKNYASGVILGNQTSGTNNSIISSPDALHVSFAVNTAGALNDNIFVPRADGRWHAERTGANAGALYFNAASVGTTTKNSNAPSAQNMYGLAYNNNGSIIGYGSLTVGLLYAGSAIGAANMAAWDALVSTLMHALDPTDY